MSEERAVQQVLARYVRGTDARDGAAVAAVFTEECVSPARRDHSPRKSPEFDSVTEQADITIISPRTAQ
jgi:hypothetical protein